MAKSQAQWRLLLPKDTSDGDDRLYLAITFEDLRLGLIFPDAKAETATHLLDLARSLLPRCHVEYEAHKASGEIDTDLDRLFGEDDG